MGRDLTRIVWLSLLALTLADCSSFSSKPKVVEPNIFPAEYKKEILDTLTSMLNNPRQLRDASITEPVLRQTGRDERYTVCVRSNSRDAAGRYPGVQERIAYFFGGHLNQLIDATENHCAGAVYKPYPELEKFCVGNNCKS